jgi:hypothetical protein
MNRPDLTEASRKVAIAITALIPVGSKEPRAQAQQDASHVRSAIMTRMRVPMKPLPRIVTTHRSETDPDVTCGYLDASNVEVPATYKPFAINVNDLTGPVYELGIDGQADYNWSAEYEAIKMRCGGEPLSYPGYDKGHRP